MNKKQLTRKFGHSAINICSGEGDMVVNAQGYPFFKDSLPYEYRNITQFDITMLDKMCLANHIPLRNEWDILAVGYWLEDGSYEDPAEDYAEAGLMRHIWNGTVEDYYEAYEHEYGHPLDDS
jgi:hypothetical protein